MSQSKSGMNLPLSASACSSLHGHILNSAGKFFKYRSFIIQLLHFPSGQFEPSCLSHCGAKYQPKGIGLLQITLKPTLWLIIKLTKKKF